MTRALLEGVAFGLKDSFGLLVTAGLAPVRQVRVAGGGAQSMLWRQILADVLGLELITVTTTEGGAYGAALLAGVGAGTWPDVASACRATIQPGPSTVPDERSSATYEAIYARYRALYPVLRETNIALAAVEEKASQ